MCVHFVETDPLKCSCHVNGMFVLLKQPSSKIENSKSLFIELIQTIDDFNNNSSMNGVYVLFLQIPPAGNI